MAAWAGPRCDKASAAATPAAMSPTRRAAPGARVSVPQRPRPAPRDIQLLGLKAPQRDDGWAEWAGRRGWVHYPEARELAEFVRPDLEAAGYRVFLISAVTHEGLSELKFAMAQAVAADRAARPAAPAPRLVVRPKPVDSEEEASAFIAEYLTVSVKALFSPQ